uniref:non-reducing end alpha-L-arabinofuranosidase n=2 Tax=Chrysotila carterae TaxID=13221 RepID=A0A7S4F1N6_CHRCT
MASAPPPPLVASICPPSFGKLTKHASPLWLGCHSDPGFVHTPRFFDANLVFNPALASGGCLAGDEFSENSDQVDSLLSYSLEALASSTEEPSGSEHVAHAVQNGIGPSGWTTRITGTGSAGLSLGTSFQTKPAMRLSLSGVGRAALVNRGFGSAGLRLLKDHAYNVEIWAFRSARVTLFAELRNWKTGAMLARAETLVQPTGPPWGATWKEYSFALTPSANTDCVQIPFGSEAGIDCGSARGDAHVCVRCDGELVVGIMTLKASPPTKTVDDAQSSHTQQFEADISRSLKKSFAGADSFRPEPNGVQLSIGYVSLMPGAWGRVAGVNGAPLPALKAAADVLRTMGTRVMRAGGTVSQSLRWKDWRGPPWTRPSSGHAWGRSLLAGWGPFEYVDLCNALGITPVLTLAYDANDADDWADLVEYAWGDATTTTWGRRRAADGHAAPYNVSAFELGNEQYNPFFVEQVAAMELRAKQLGAPPLRYIFPSTYNALPTDADLERMASLGLPFERILMDIHVGAGGALAVAKNLFSRTKYPIGAANLETNAGAHDLRRALLEAADVLAFFNAPAELSRRIWARTASFCSGASLQFDEFDQALSFSLPQMTWLQPPGHVHAMLAESWAETTLNSTLSRSDGGAVQGTAAFAAQRTENGARVILAVNRAAAPQAFSVRLMQGVAPAPTHNVTGMMRILTGGADSFDNSPDDPNRISPRNVAMVHVSGAGRQLDFVMPPFSFGISSF